MGQGKENTETYKCRKEDNLIRYYGIEDGMYFLFNLLETNRYT